MIRLPIDAAAVEPSDLVLIAAVAEEEEEAEEEASSRQRRQRGWRNTNAPSNAWYK